MLNRTVWEPGYQQTYSLKNSGIANKVGYGSNGLLIFVKHLHVCFLFELMKVSVGLLWESKALRTKVRKRK